MRKVSNLTVAFVPFSFVLGYLGVLTLRWFQLMFLYRTIDQFFVGIGTTIGAVTVLAAVMAIFFIKTLAPMNRITKRIELGQAVTREDVITAGKTKRILSILVFVENAFGFIVGQVSVAVIDFVSGNLPFTPSRFAIVVVQAVCVALIVSLYEIYYFDLIFKPYRESLQIYSIETYESKRKKFVSRKILIVSAVTLVFMGTNAFSAGYGLLNGDHVSASTQVMKEYINMGLVGLLISFAECMGLMAIVCFEMKKRISSVANVIGELKQSGDLSRRINISMDDDIGLLTSYQNQLMDKLSSTINVLKDETKNVSESTFVLNDSSAKSIEALDSMKISVDIIDSEERKTNQIINSTFNDIESLKQSALQVEDQVVNQGKAVERASASIQTMAESISSISQTTKQADEISKELKNTTERGMKSILTAEEAISLIQQSSRMVQDAVDVIKKISSQTNLLAMNASIEAAHAGTFGQGFAVVADEVRNLANTTQENVQTVSQNIQEMEEKILNGVGAMQEAKSAFTSINQGVAQTADIVRKITDSVDLQKTDTELTLGATREVVDSISYIKELAVSQRQHTENVYESTRNIVESSASVSQSLSKTSQASVELEKILGKVNQCVVENTSSVKKMQEHIQDFKTQ